MKESDVQQCITRIVVLNIPLIPPSVNHYVKHTRNGRHYVTKEAKAFKEAVALIARGSVLHGPEYSVEIAIYLGRGERGDIDNFAKCVLDGLVSANVIHSDSAINQLHITKGRDAEKPRTEITVRSI